MLNIPIDAQQAKQIALDYLYKDQEERIVRYQAKHPDKHDWERFLKMDYVVMRVGLEDGRGWCILIEHRLVGHPEVVVTPDFSIYVDVNTGAIV